MTENKGKKVRKKSARQIPVNNLGEENPADAPVESEMQSMSQKTGSVADEYDELLVKIASEDIPVREDESPSVEEPKLQKSVEDELKDMTENWQRERASFRNYKRRVEEEKSEIRKYAKYDLALDLLRILDYFESSVSFSENLPQEANNVLIGVKYTIDELTRILHDHNIVPVAACEGQPVDPSTMEVIERMETEAQKEGTILKVHRRGWKLHDRILRTCQVVVAAAPVEKINGISSCDSNEKSNASEGGE